MREHATRSRAAVCDFTDAITDAVSRVLTVGERSAPRRRSPPPTLKRRCATRRRRARPAGRRASCSTSRRARRALRGDDDRVHRLFDDHVAQHVGSGLGDVVVAASSSWWPATASAPPSSPSGSSSRRTRWLASYEALRTRDDRRPATSSTGRDDGEAPRQPEPHEEGERAHLWRLGFDGSRIWSGAPATRPPGPRCSSWRASPAPLPRRRRRIATADDRRGDSGVSGEKAKTAKTATATGRTGDDSGGGLLRASGGEQTSFDEQAPGGGKGRVAGKEAQAGLNCKTQHAFKNHNHDSPPQLARLSHSPPSCARTTDRLLDGLDDERLAVRVRDDAGAARVLVGADAMVAGVGRDDGVRILRAQRVDGEAEDGVKRRPAPPPSFVLSDASVISGPTCLRKRSPSSERRLDHTSLDNLDRRAGNVAALRRGGGAAPSSSQPSKGLARHKRRGEVARALCCAEASRRPSSAQRSRSAAESGREDARGDKRNDQRRERALELVRRILRLLHQESARIRARGPRWRETAPRQRETQLDAISRLVGSQNAPALERVRTQPPTERKHAVRAPAQRRARAQSAQPRVDCGIFCMAPHPPPPTPSPHPPPLNRPGPRRVLRNKVIAFDASVGTTNMAAGFSGCDIRGEYDGELDDQGAAAAKDSDS